MYASECAAGVDAPGVNGLVEAARIANAAADITGALLYSGRRFFQVLEGEVVDVERLYARIIVDPRHRDVRRLIGEPTTLRRFPRHPMACGFVQDAVLDALIEAQDLEASSTALASVEDREAREVVTTYLRGRWRARSESRQRRGRSSA